MTECPPGYRFLVQFVENTSAEVARERLARMFGTQKAAAALMRPGTYRPACLTNLYGEWKQYPTGFRFYLPIGWNA